MAQLNYEQVLAFLPHRDPFLFIHKVESVKIEGRDIPLGETVHPSKLLGAEVVAYYTPKSDLDIFKGHFPDFPVLPGVIQVEMMAQASGFTITTVNEDPFNRKYEMALLGVSNAKFRRPVKPNMELKICAKCTRIRGNIMSYDCQIFSENELISEATVMASVKF